VTLVVGVSVDGARIPIARDRVARLARATLRAERVSAAMLSLSFVGNSAMRRLNRAHLGRAGDTDVISFAFRPLRKGAPLVGDIYIAPEVAKQSAKANGVTIREELVRLIIHGVLHAVGHDHPEGASRLESPMWKRQELLVRRFARSA
jgi:probable rRNA maturation factor